MITAVKPRKTTTAKKKSQKTDINQQLDMIRQICKEMAVKYPEAQQAKDEANKKVEKEITMLKEVGALFIRRHIDSIIDSVRAEMNRATRDKTRRKKYSHKSTCNFIEDPKVQEIAAISFEYNMGGNQIGSIFGYELDGLIESHVGQARTATVHVEVCRRLKSVVKPKQRVREAIKLVQLNRIWKEAWRLVDQSSRTYSEAGN